MHSPESGSATSPADRAATEPDRLDNAFQHWRAQSWRWHLLALGLLALVGLARFWAPLSADVAHIDESLYEGAFQAVAEGRSPYEVRGYYYPTFFALAGSWLTELLGTASTRLLLRAANLLGLVIALWVSAAWWLSAAWWVSAARTQRLDDDLGHSDRRTWLERFAFAGLLLVAAPGIADGIHLGNLSFVAIGLALPALALAGTWPLRVAPPLALSVALKPIAAAIFPLMVLTPPRNRTQVYRLAGVLGGTLTLILWLSFPYFTQLLDQSIERIAYIRTWSAYRLADVLGLGIPRLLLLALIVACAVAAGRWARATHAGWMALAVTASVLATPLIWGHTVVMAFPVIAMAGSLARHRWQRRKGRSRAWVEPWFVGTGCAILLFTNAGAIDDLPRLIEALLLMMPVATPAALTAYVILTSRQLST